MGVSGNTLVYEESIRKHMGAPGKYQESIRKHIGVSGTYQETYGCIRKVSGKYQENIRKVSGTNLQDSSGMFRNVQKCSGMFRNVQEPGSKVHETANLATYTVLYQENDEGRPPQPKRS